MAGDVLKSKSPMWRFALKQQQVQQQQQQQDKWTG